MQADIAHIRVSPVLVCLDGHISLFGYWRILSAKKKNTHTAEQGCGKQSEILTMK